MPKNIIKNLKILERDISMKTFQEYIREGMYDPGIFKAFWLAGGPGSGKSKVTGEITGSWVGDVEKTKDRKKQLRFVAGRTGPLGLKIINSDEILSKMLIDAGMHLRMDQYTAAEKEQKETIRDEAKKLLKKRQKNYVLGRLGLVLDGTGKNYDKVSTASNSLRAIGYNTYMIFVNTSLDVALQRNEMRTRKIDETDVEDMWKAVQQNMGKFQQYFGPKNFIIVDNNTAYEEGSNSEKLFFGKIFAQISKLIRTPTDNAIASKWIANELRMKQLMFED